MPTEENEINEVPCQIPVKQKNLILCLCNNKWCIKVDRYVFISILMVGLKSKSIKTLTLTRLMSGCLVRLGGWHQKPPAEIKSHQVRAHYLKPLRNGRQIPPVVVSGATSQAYGNGGFVI